jgi:hypothetical protein
MILRDNSSAKNEIAKAAALLDRHCKDKKFVALAKADKFEQCEKQC